MAAPKPADTLNMEQLVYDANRAAQNQTWQQNQGLGSLAFMLADPDTQRGRLSAYEALAERGMMRDAQGQLGRFGNLAEQQAMMAGGEAGPTSIEQEMYAQGLTDLRLGRALSPEQQREATQSARAAFAARGLGTSAGGAAAEILNRDRYATARQDARRQFAADANTMLSDNVLKRRQGAAQIAGMGSDIANARAGVGAQMAQIGLSGAQSLLNLSPYQRALALGGSLIGGTYDRATKLAGDTASFNANMLDSRYNSYQNNQAALQGAAMQSGASRNSGMMGMFSGIGGGLLTGAGMAI
jgi:hypothetical protein